MVRCRWEWLSPPLTCGCLWSPLDGSVNPPSQWNVLPLYREYDCSMCEWRSCGERQMLGGFVFSPIHGASHLGSYVSSSKYLLLRLAVCACSIWNACSLFLQPLNGSFKWTTSKWREISSHQGMRGVFFGSAGCILLKNMTPFLFVGCKLPFLSSQWWVISFLNRSHFLKEQISFFQYESLKITCKTN